MERQCKNCKHYSPGVSNELRRKWEYSNFGRWADGICTLEFPRGYIARKPPHPAIATGHCFQYDEKSRQMEMEGIR